MNPPVSYGTLYVVATPIGNLEDMTFRAVTILKQVDLIAAEDTRHSKILLDHYGIGTRLISCHEHNETAKTPLLISHLKKGLNLALISDAGTPTLSDPGYPLVSAAVEENIPVLPIPGCSAAIAGLSVSGLPTDAFYFSGFPPRKTGKLKQAIESLKNLQATLIFYESPKRVKKLLETLIPLLGDRRACLTREITKLHEEYLRGSLSRILQQLELKESIKGECALFVQGREPIHGMMDEEDLERLILEQLTASGLGTFAAGWFAFAWLAKKPRIAYLGAIAGTNLFVHLFFDTVASRLRWFYPLSEHYFNFVRVPARYDWWVLNFVLHWTFIIEIVFIVAATLLFVRSWRSVRKGARSSSEEGV